MKKLLTLLFAGAIVAAMTVPAQAIPFFNDAFKAKYTEGNASYEAVVNEAKCNVCHYGRSKKNRNDYGMALSELLDRKEFKGRFASASEADQKKVLDAIEKVEKQKGTDGKAFGEKISVGQLPGIAPETAE